MKNIKLDIVVLAGSYFYYTNWLVLLSKRRLKFLVYFWSETQSKEKSNHNSFHLFIREVFRETIYRKFDGFWDSIKLSKEFTQNYVKKEERMYFVPNLIVNLFYLEKEAESRPCKNEMRKKWNILLEKKVLSISAELFPQKKIANFLALLRHTKIKNSTLVLIPGTDLIKDEIDTRAKGLNVDIQLFGFQQLNGLPKLRFRNSKMKEILIMCLSQIRYSTLKINQLVMGHGYCFLAK